MENIKTERYPEYRNSGENWLGEVPANWELTRLGTRFFERRTKVSDKDYTPLSVTKQGILPQLDSAAKTNDGDNRKLVKAGDFVINSRSDRKGSSGISNLDGSVSLINIVIEPKGINPIFCNYLFKSNGFIEEFYRNGHGIVADLWTTRYDEMKAIKIAIPSKSEQTRITAFLDQKTTQIDQSIAQKERLIELLKERRQILIHNAVTRGLNPNVRMKDSGVEWIGMIPEHWEVMRVKQCSSKISKGTTPSTEGRSILDEGAIRYIKAENIQDGFITDYPAHFIDEKTNSLIKRSELRENDVLFVIAGATLGKVAIISRAETPSNTNQAVAFVRPNSNVFPRFLSIWLTSSVIKELTWLDAVQSAQPNLSMENLGNFPIFLPDFEEQKSIIEYVQKIETKIATAIACKQAEIEKLKEYKATLINSAVTGKIKV